ncbi:uncharacterized protein PHACADRAFT_259941 [Phanerochaete carnosa HHB-10118-sp]|uniref:Uncharacterized protein n=1 Tax=Phanerochaete carnosa (strain HHB-10118-sp) TaxID=650164 RepID=K5WSX4_PHACS|nr:uncharacterized protein PHACADRAFT_259941 [Phanerochaete carnosa HHB-10118-sp]EKM53522.1 hypothetical protein PHACADRAFT_259941 [Phanerochaete carnosa HHB-10118-sp]
MAAAAAPPLQYNSRTGEPFIRLPSPHENLILTPPRPSDVAANYSWMTDPKVYKMLEGPPFPYLESNAISWNEIITTQAAEAMREFQEAQAAERSTGTKTFVGTCPVRYIREVQEDGSDVALGDIDAHRCQFPAVRDPDEKARLAEENNARELGDPDIVWCIGSK